MPETAEQLVYGDLCEYYHLMIMTNTQLDMKKIHETYVETRKEKELRTLEFVKNKDKPILVPK